MPFESIKPVQQGLRLVVCHVKIPGMVGGVEILTEDLASELRKRGHEVEVVSIPLKRLTPREIIKTVFSWYSLDFSKVAGKKIDAVICTKFPSWVLRHPKKIVWLTHQFRQAYDRAGKGSGFFRRVVRAIDNYTLAGARIFSISKNVQSRLLKYNGISSEVLYPPPRGLAQFHSGKYGTYVFAPSRIDPWKRQHLLLEALARTGTDLSVVFAGPVAFPAYQRKLEALVSKLGLEKRVVFKGEVSRKKLIDLYARCRAVWFAPQDEDYGYVTVEALLSGKPVLTTVDAGGPLEFVVHGKNGLVSSADPKEIAQNLDAVFLAPRLARKLGQNGRLLSTRFDWGIVIQNLLKDVK